MATTPHDPLLDPASEALKPQPLAALKVQHWHQLLCWSADTLEAHSVGLNQLNVYPIADHDTGDNASSTLRALADATRSDASSYSAFFADVAAAAPKAACGSSGLALSRYLNAATESLVNVDRAGPLDLALALEAAAEAVAESFTPPQVGTIVSVAEEVARAALLVADASSTLEHVVLCACEAGVLALEATTHQIDILQKEGVVDAGGAALMVVVDVLAAIVCGDPCPAETVEAPSPRKDVLGGEILSEQGLVDVMLVVHASSEAVQRLVAKWAAAGFDTSREQSGDSWALTLRCTLAASGDAIQGAISLGAVSGLEISPATGLTHPQGGGSR